MTDFVHEPPKDPDKQPAPAEEKPATERERMKKVYTYVAVLFAVAFLLILWTFLMNQRSFNEIKDGNSALLDTLEESELLQARVAELENEVSSLKDQLASAEEDKKALAETVGTQSDQLRALDWLAEIERDYGARNYDAARENIRAFHDTAAGFLPGEPLRTAITGDDAPSPAARYQDIVDALFPGGVN